MLRFLKEDSYPKNIEKATIAALLLVIFLFLLFPKLDINKKNSDQIVFTYLNVEDIPVTKHGTRKKPPPKPAVPIPSDDELIPEDVTIEETELDFEQYSDITGPGFVSGQPVVFQPRPVFEVIPEYPQELQKKGIQGSVKLHLHVNKKGLVDDVVVLENTTGSPRCASAAKSAALKGRYIPAKQSKQPTDIWITRTYSFGLQK